METRDQILSKVKKYLIEVLEPSRPELFGLPACPFIKAERIKNNIMYEILSDGQSLTDLIKSFVKSDYTTAVIVQLFPDGDPLPASEVFEYQMFVNGLIKDAGIEGYKCICISPDQKLDIKGFSPRSLAPYFLINIGEQEEFDRTHNLVTRTRYFENFSDEYKTKLNY